MSDVLTWSQLKDRVRTKWQVPLFALSLVLLTTSFFKLQTTPTELSMDQAVDYIKTLIDNGMYDRALRIGDVLTHRPGETDRERAVVHKHLARALYEKTISGSNSFDETGNDIIEHYRQVMTHRIRLDAEDYFRMGRVLELQKREEVALRYYHQALDRGVTNAMDLRKHIINLSRDHLKVGPENINTMLDSFLTEVSAERLDLRFWAIEEKLDVLEELGRLDHAATLLTRNQAMFHDSDYRDQYSYLEAMLLYKDGYFNEAETRLRTIRNRIEKTDSVYAMTGWLLGRVVMSDGSPQRPMEAMSFFTDVLKYHPEGPYALASRIGIAESLALLERHDEAVHHYRISLEDLDWHGYHRLVNRDVLRVSLGVLANMLQQEGQIEPALEYALIARSLLTRENVEQSSSILLQVGQLQTLRAQQLEREVAGLDEPAIATMKQNEAFHQFNRAGETFLEIAKINIVNDREAAQALWRAAELFARAQKIDRAVEMYTTFAKERPQHSLVPRAWLRKGYLLQSAAKLPEAIEAFQQAYRRFPRMLDGARALVPLAQSYLALGPENVELAEKTLRIVLDDSEVFTPNAPEFSEALFLLGDVLMRRGAYEQAIATLEEALERYPNDPRIGRIRFLLANAYRQSALALRSEGENSTVPVEINQIRNEASHRFAIASDLFRALIRDYELHELQKLTRLEKTYLRHAYMFEADCFFETQQYLQALKLYEEAAGLYKDLPTGLSAYVQIINCHVFLGEAPEARAALSRAMVLVDAIDDRVFQRSVSPETRDDWKRYFEWLDQSEMF